MDEDALVSKLEQIWRGSGSAVSDPRLGIERVSVVDQVRGVAQEAIDRVE